jgi:serine/threonine protein kinase
MPELFSQYFQPVLPPGTILNGKQRNRYKIIDDTVNAGGFGRIYRAELNQIYKGNSWKIVALKEFCINPSEFEQYKHTFVGTHTMANIDEDIKTMQLKFRKEAELLKHINRQRDRHVPMIEEGIFIDQDRMFYAMTYIDGPTLTDVVKGHGPMSEEQAVDYIAQIGKLLYKTHSWETVHCDISPNNIMIENGFAILVDFGNARSYNKFWESITKKQDQDLLSIADDKAKQVGTRGFCPPQQYIGTKQGDIYSLAATLYFLLTAETLLKKLSSQRSKDNAISKLKSHNVSDKTVNAIMHALDLESADSTKDAKTFLWQLPYDIVFNSLLNYNDYDYNK